MSRLAIAVLGGAALLAASMLVETGVPASSVAAQAESAQTVLPQTVQPQAESAQASPVRGVVSGTVRNGTAGAPLPSLPALAVQLIVVTRQGAVTSVQTTAEGGRFRFEVPADPAVTYLLRTEYQGVPYIDQAPVLLSAEASSATRELTVYEVTRDRPTQRIRSTVVMVRGIDPEQSRLHLERRDTVVTSGDRVYVGTPDGVTLRVPAPEGIRGVSAEQGLDGKAAVDGQTVTSTQPLRPGETVVVTDLVVGYDPALDTYRVRAVAPLPTERLEVWVPKRFAGTVEAGSGAARAADRDADDERWTVVERRGAAQAGESLLVTLRGLSGRNAPNALVTLPGAGVAAAVALAIVAGGVAAASRWRGGRGSSVIDVVAA